MFPVDDEPQGLLILLHVFPLRRRKTLIVYRVEHVPQQRRRVGELGRPEILAAGVWNRNRSYFVLNAAVELRIEIHSESVSRF